MSLHLHLSRSLADRWGTAVDSTTNFFHSSRFSAFRSKLFHSRPVHSLMLSSHRFLCLPLRLPPCTVPSRIVLASPDDLVTCPYHFSLRLLTEVRRSSYGPMAFSILVLTSSYCPSNMQSESHGLICLDNCMCFLTETKTADQTCLITQSRYTDI